MSIKRTFSLLLVAFFVGICVGMAYTYVDPKGAGEYVLRLMKEIGSLSPNPCDNFVKIFIHNTMVALFVLVSGLFFGLGPWLMVLFNGIVVGIVVGVLIKIVTPANKVFLGLVPHGIVEIPAFVLAGTAGILWYRSIKESENPGVGFTKGLKKALKLYAVTVGMLLVAAFIEAYVTPKVAGL